MQKRTIDLLTDSYKDQMTAEENMNLKIKTEKNC